MSLTRSKLTVLLAVFLRICLFVSLPLYQSICLLSLTLPPSYFPSAQAWDLLDDAMTADSLGTLPSFLRKLQLTWRWLTADACPECGEPVPAFLWRCSWSLVRSDHDEKPQFVRVGPALVTVSACDAVGAAAIALATLLCTLLICGVALLRV